MFLHFTIKLTDGENKLIMFNLVEMIITDNTDEGQNKIYAFYALP